MFKSPAKVAISEETPLLAASIECGDAFDLSTPRRRRWQTMPVITNLFIAVLMLVAFGAELTQAPQMRINEAILCYHHYEKVDPSKLSLPRNQVGPGAIGGVAESLCKVDEVQNELAALNGWALLFAQIPSLLLAVPYGWAADKYGRWPVIFLGILSIVFYVAWQQAVTWFWQTFDIRMQWLSAAFYLVGGGNVVTSAMAYVFMTDITPESERAGLFLRVSAFSLSSGLLMPPLASWLMEYDPWIPNLCGTSLLVLGLLLMFLVPETLNWRSAEHQSSAVEVDGHPAAAEEPFSWKTSIGRLYRRSTASIAFLTTDWRIPALMIPFVGYMVMLNGGPMLLQYLSKRFGVSLARATLVMSVRSASLMVLFLAIVPAISHLLMTRLRLSSQRKDLYLARAMQLVNVAGYLVIALSPTLPGVVVGVVITSLCLAAPTLLRSFMASVIPPAHVARTFVVLGIVDSFGLMAGAPILAWVFKCGLRAGGIWTGLPFFCIAVVTALCAIVLFLVRIRPSEDAAHLAQFETEEEGQGPLIIQPDDVEHLIP